MSGKEFERSLFEAWISSPPYERSVDRYSGDQSTHAWPHQYKDIAVQLAWEAWMESRDTDPTL